MRAYLAIVSRHFSERIPGPDGTPLDLAETTLPTRADSARADRLMEALARARREMRVRLRSTPAGGDAPLRLALITTTSAGTDMDVETAPLPVQEVDFESAADRKRVLDPLRALERSLLSS